MTVPSVSWNENSPAGSDNINLGDNRIREMKTQIREVIGVDHKFESSGQDADNGKHNKVTMLEQADVGTGSTGEPLLGAQTDSSGSGAPELCYVNEGNTDIFLTDDGRVGNRNEDIIANTVDATGLYINGVSVLEMVYPVGSIYINATVSTNPGTLLGFGTWSAFGAGKVIVGLDSGDTDFDTAEETGGAKTHTLTVNEMPAHTHTFPLGGSDTDGGIAANGSSSNATETTSSTGGGSAHNNLQPYIVCYMWKRTA